MTTSTARRPMSASSIQGDDIVNQDGESLGSVHDIMLDCCSGKIAYVVMSSGGFLGMGNKLFAIPHSALQLDTDNECLRMNADKELFENAEGFDKDSWPDMADPKWETSTHETFNSKPYWD